MRLSNDGPRCAGSVLQSNRNTRTALSECDGFPRDKVLYSNEDPGGVRSSQVFANHSGTPGDRSLLLHLRGCKLAFRDVRLDDCACSDKPTRRCLAREKFKVRDLIFWEKIME